MSDQLLLSHLVFFTLNDNSSTAADTLVAACRKYLQGHEGEVFFAAGTRASEYQRDVNDQAFDVSLVIVFRSRADHDAYQTHERHQQFIDECHANWKSVRVFDSFHPADIVSN